MTAYMFLDDYAKKGIARHMQVLLDFLRKQAHSRQGIFIHVSLWFETEGLKAG